MSITVLQLQDLSNYNTEFELTSTTDYYVNNCLISGGTSTHIDTDGFYEVIYSASGTTFVKRFCFFDVADEITLDINTKNNYYVKDNVFLKDNKNKDNTFTIYSNRPTSAYINQNKIILGDAWFYKYYPEYEKQKIISGKTITIYDENSNVLYEMAVTI